MRVRFEERGDFTNIRAYLKKQISTNHDDILVKAGELGVSLLKNNTPKRSGITAQGWGYKIVKESSSRELIFFNNAHPELSVNLAVLIQLGHGTRNGGYVPPVDYIRPAILPVYKMVGEAINRRLGL